MKCKELKNAGVFAAMASFAFAVRAAWASDKPTAARKNKAALGGGAKEQWGEFQVTPGGAWRREMAGGGVR